ncbi:MAG: hypothetical protein LUC86_06765 [Prevotellaceae bacterium]|nr:hypothetical protein [Prevotellaceae bacterium]
MTRKDSVVRVWLKGGERELFFGSVSAVCQTLTRQQLGGIGERTLRRVLSETERYENWAVIVTRGAVTRSRGAGE